MLIKFGSWAATRLTSVAQLMTESTSESALHIAKLAIGSNCITFRYWLSSAELSISVRQASSGRRLRRMMLWQQRADDGDDNGWQQGQLIALLSGRRSVVRIADLAIRKGGSVGEVADCPTMPPQAPALSQFPPSFGDIGALRLRLQRQLVRLDERPRRRLQLERERLITGNTVITADSTGNKDGKYMFPKPVGPSNGKKCRLLSPTFDAYPGVLSQLLLLHQLELSRAAINVYWANGRHLGEPIFSIFEEKTSAGFEARLNLFGTRVGHHPSSRPADINCDFELGKCNYWNQQLQGWSRKLRAAGGHRRHRPQTDHTTGSRMATS
uniref:MAM domain-containing protein n=1 Tax=Macrostomum lignano TaxID=282301 RepID=A0A1I8F635_9PLAT